MDAHAGYAWATLENTALSERSQAHRHMVCDSTDAKRPGQAETEAVSGGRAPGGENGLTAAEARFFLEQ